MADVGYRFYFLFIVCNFTNAIFFWLFLPETARRSLETMNAFFTEAPLLVPGRTKKYAPPERMNSEATVGKEENVSEGAAADHKEVRDF